MQKLEPVILRDYSGGVNNSVSNAFMPANTLRFALNMYSDPQKAPFGSLISRTGVTAVRNVDEDMSLNLSNCSVVGLFSSKDNQILIGITNSSTTPPKTFIYYSADYASAFVNIGPAPFDWGSQVGHKIRFAQFIGYTFACDGTYIKSWDGNVANNWGATNLTGSPTGHSIEEFQGKLYVSQNITYTSRVYFSSVPDITTNIITWNTTNDWFDVESNDGDEIVAMKKAGNVLLIWKRKSLYVWDGSTLSLIASVGTINQENVQVINDKVFFAYLEDVNFSIYMYSGGIVQKISTPMNGWLNSPEDDSSLQIPSSTQNRGVGNYYGAWSDDDNYFIWINGRERKEIYSKGINQIILFSKIKNIFPNIILKYNISTNTWNELSINSPVISNQLSNRIYFSTKIFITSPANKITVLAGTNTVKLSSTTSYSISPWYWNNPSDKQLYSSDTEDKIAKTIGTNTYQYIPISIYIQTREEEFGSRSRIKTINSFNVFANGAYSNMTLGMRIDGKKWEELGKLTGRITKFNPGKSGYFFEFKIYGETLGNKGASYISTINNSQQFIFEGFEFYDIDIEDYET